MTEDSSKVFCPTKILWIKDFGTALSPILQVRNIADIIEIRQSPWGEKLYKVLKTQMALYYFSLQSPSKGPNFLFVGYGSVCATTV